MKLSETPKIVLDYQRHEARYEISQELVKVGGHIERPVPTHDQKKRNNTVKIMLEPCLETGVYGKNQANLEVK